MEQNFIDQLIRFLPSAGRKDADGRFLTLHTDFPDPEGLLETAYNRVKSSCSAPLLLTVKCTETPCFEAYTCETLPGKCTICAADTEGVRRGLYELAGMLDHLSPGELPARTVSRKPWLKTRIARCFFGPIKRPPLNRDELLDDVDYYPDAYLDRLAYEAVNMLWISISLKDYLPEAPDRARRISKLSGTVAKCRRYGIAVSIFCNEPAAVPHGAESPFGYAGGPLFLGRHLFCVHHEEALKKLEDLVYGIFRDVPHLGGMINICFGEGPTTCLSNYGGPTACRSVCGYSPREIMYKNLSAMADGMKKASPDALYFAWFYIALPEEFPDWGYDVMANAPENVIVQLNFESGLEKVQHGKRLVGGDYWFLSEDSSKYFAEFAGRLCARGHEFSAKIQAGCSHEVATVPYIPAPSILYRKFRSMKRLRVSHAMLGWYFGTTPGLMNEAAGRLAFTDFDACSEEQFLRELALPLWGAAHAPEVEKLWKTAGEAYLNYPFINSFQYFGPVADGVRWPLYPEYAEKGLRPTWITNPDNPSGDNISECLNHNSLEDVTAQMRLLSEGWHQAAELAAELEKEYRNVPDCMRELRLIHALDLQFASAYHILYFYLLRRKLYQEKSLAVLDEMRQTAEAEIHGREELVSLIRQDPRLGFHPEAETMKYDEKLIRKSMDSISIMLEKDIPRIAEKLRNGTFGNDRGHVYRIHPGEKNDCGSFFWTFEEKDGSVVIDIFCKGRHPVMDELFVGIDVRDRGYYSSHVLSDGTIYRPLPGDCRIEPGKDFWRATYTIPVSCLPDGRRDGLRLNIFRFRNSYSEYDQWPPHAHKPEGRVQMIFYEAANMGLLDVCTDS